MSCLKHRDYCHTGQCVFCLQARVDALEADLEEAFREGLTIGEENVCTDGYFPLDKEHDELVAAWRERRGGGK